MPLDPRARRFLDVLAASQARATLDTRVDERRQAVAELMRFCGPPIAMQRVEAGQLPGPAGPLELRIYTPRDSPGGFMPALVYFHGGGLIAGSIATHDPVARALAQAAACRVLAVDYRLAPEHPFPAAVEDALAAVDFIAARARDFGIDPDRLGVCGDSAGATLAAVACQQRARRGARDIALQLLLCPILDHLRDGGSWQEFANGYLLDQGTLEHDLLHYLPAGADRGDARVSPLRGPDLAGMPTTLVHAAECDPLRDEAAAYAARLEGAGVTVAYTCHPGMIHLFYGLGGVIPYARTAMERIGAEVRETWRNGLSSNRRG